MKEIIKRLDKIENLLKSKEDQEKYFLNVDEAASFLGLSKSGIYKLIHKKEITYFKPGGKKIFVRKCDLEEWIALGQKTFSDWELSHLDLEKQVGKLETLDYLMKKESLEKEDL